MLYEILTGKQAFTGATEFARLTAIMTEEVVPPSAISPTLAQFDMFFQRALQKDRAHRFQSAQEMSQALASVGVPVSIVPPSGGGTTVSPVGPTMSSPQSQPPADHTTLGSQGVPPSSYRAPPPVVIVPGATQDPNSFAGPPRGVSQLVVVLLVTVALMAGFFLGFAVAKQM
jgi:serine/threonine-protein kinase